MLLSSLCPVAGHYTVLIIFCIILYYEKKGNLRTGEIRRIFSRKTVKWQTSFSDSQLFVQIKKISDGLLTSGMQHAKLQKKFNTINR